MIINDLSLAADVLKTIGYFPVIGGYKTPFINPMTRIYEPNTSFEDIFALYLFDRKLRDVFFHYLCDLEIHMRQIISYYFCKRHGEQQKQYLSAANFDCSTKKKTASVNKLISILSYQANKNTDHAYLVHQRTVHNNVPLWVVMKALTFGQTSKFYSVLKFQMKGDICQDFIHIDEDTLSSYLEKLCLLRNACAHNERLYSFHFDKDFPDSVLHGKMNIPMKGEQYLYGKTDLFSAVIALRYLLPSKTFLAFKRELMKSIKDYLKKTKRIDQHRLYEFMGFPENWESITRYKL